MGDMAKVERIPVTPAVLEWARKSAGFDTALAAKKMAFQPSQVSDWEAGNVLPTIVQLRKMAAVYKRPLSVLLLSEPPADFDALRDFRRLSTAHESAWSPELHFEFRRSLSQREVVLELGIHAETEWPESLATGTTNIDAEVLGQRLRAALGIDGWSKTELSDPYKVLRKAIDQVESWGVLVVQTKDVDIAEMRGFSIAEWPWPVVALNGADWPRPRLFTLLHELGHLAISEGGLCDLHDQRPGRRSADEATENYCNVVAAAVLLPADAVHSDSMVVSRPNNHQWTLDELQELSGRFGASSEATLLRLISLGLTSWDVYHIRKPELDKAYREARQIQKERQKAATGGPDFYVLKAGRLGRAYVASVLEAFHAHQISSLDVADYLEVRYEQLKKLERVVS